MDASLKMKAVYTGIVFLICIVALKGEEPIIAPGSSNMQVIAKNNLTSTGPNVTIVVTSDSSSELIKFEKNTTNKSTDRFMTTLTDTEKSKGITVVNMTNSTPENTTQISDDKISSTMIRLYSNSTIVDSSTKSNFASSSGKDAGILTSSEHPENLTSTSSEVSLKESTSSLSEISSKATEGLITESSEVPLNNSFSALPKTSSGNPEDTTITSSNITSPSGTTSKTPADIIATSPKAKLNISTSPFPSSSSRNPVDITTTFSNSTSFSETTYISPKDIRTSPSPGASSESQIDSSSISSKVPENVSSTGVTGTPETSTSSKEKASSVMTTTFPSSVGGLSSNVDSELPLPTFATAGNRALKLVVSITFLVIAVVATAVLLVYMIRIKRRTVLYEELSLLP